MARMSRHKRGLVLARKYGFVCKRGIIYRKVPGRGLVRVMIKRHKRHRRGSRGRSRGHNMPARRITAKQYRACLRNLRKARRALWYR